MTPPQTSLEVVLTAAERALELTDGATRVVNAGLRLQSVQVREVLARMVDPTLDYAALTSIAGDRPLSTGSDSPREAALTRELARLVGLQNRSRQDLTDAIALYDRSRRTVPVGDWHSRDIRVYTQLLWIHDRGRLGLDHELLDALPADFREFVRADLEGFRTFVGSSSWIGHFNAILQARGVDAIGLHAPGGTPFDRLGRVAGQNCDTGPLISVIMPAFRPGPEIFTAIRSVVEQTWQNWELLIVDDGSGQEYEHVFDDAVALDPRARLIRQKHNLGTYAARNRALELAQGAFITVQDVDDWSHPQRLELQAQPLINNASVLRTLSRCIRASAQLEFQYLGFHPLRNSASSHMFRRSILDSVGRFDWVRKSADTEFDRRLEAAFPGQRVHLSQPLSLYRLASTSLSRGDFRPGWMHPARAEYRSSMLYWHGQIAAGASPLLPAEVDKRPLSAPRPYLSGLGLELPDVDIAYMADWTRAGAVERAAIGEMQALVAAGTRVGVVHVRSDMTAASAPAPHAVAIRRMIADGSVTAVTLEESSRVPTLVVRRPEVLEWPTDRPVAMEVGRVVIMAEDFPLGEDSVGRSWTVSDCDNNAAALFGVRPWWWIDGGIGLDVVLECVEPARILREPIPQILESGAHLTMRRRPYSHSPTVGWIFDDLATLPNPSQLTSVFPSDGSIDIRLLGPRELIKRLLGHVPARWLVYDEGELSSREFWDQVDIVVGFPANPKRRSATLTVREGRAAGCKLVLDRVLSEAVGDPAACCRIEDIPRVIQEFRVSMMRGDREIGPGEGGTGSDLAAQGAVLRTLLDESPSSAGLGP